MVIVNAVKAINNFLTGEELIKTKMLAGVTIGLTKAKIVQLGTMVKLKAEMIAQKAAMLASKTATIVLTKAKIAQLGTMVKLKAAMIAQKAAMLASKTVTIATTVAQWALNSAFLACPLTWIVVAVMAVVAVFVILWNKCEGFRNFWKKVWDGIVKEFNAAVEWISAGIKKLVGWFESIGGWFKNLFGGGKKSIDVSVTGDNVKAAENAIGSTITRPTLTWVGEGGDTETIVPHNNKPRSRALALEAVKGTGVGVGGNTFVFSPNITVNGGNANEVRSIIDDEINKFKAQMEEWSKGQRRLAY